VLQMEQMSIVVRVFLLKTGEIRERLLHNWVMMVYDLLWVLFCTFDFCFALSIFHFLVSENTKVLNIPSGDPNIQEISLQLFTWMVGNVLSVNPTTSLVHITPLPTVHSVIHPQIPVVLQMEQISIVVRVFYWKPVK
jgi:hypothetical protein